MSDQQAGARGESLARLGPFLPMIYVAWADGDLDPSEVDAVRSAATNAAASDPLLQEAVADWLDPKNPPTASELAAVLGQLRTMAEKRQLSSDRRVDLAALGLDLIPPDAPVGIERSALAEVQEALGIDGGEAARQLLATGRPPSAPYRGEVAFDAESLSSFLSQPRKELRERVKGLLCEPRFAYPQEPTRAEYRETVFGWVQDLAGEGLGAFAYPELAGGTDDTEASMVVFETLALGDLSLLIKFGVQFGLFGGSIHQLGTQRHHRDFLPAVASGELPGCFAMTETGHGSNVSDLETRAVFDRERDAFVLDTPHRGAMKNYIGNAACHGRMATVFSQLEIDGTDYGVHALLVRIRDDDGNPLPGVTIEDDGPKMGLNGLDNGRLAFDQVVVPRDHLLDRFAQVDADGTYKSPINSPTARFFAMLGTLVGGRVSIASSANAVAKVGLTIAIRYANRRRQFGPADEPEHALLDYLSHQERLLPRLAKTYAAHFSLRGLAKLYSEQSSESEADAEAGRKRRELEGLAAALKAYSTHHCTDTVQECREACGGQGYLAENRFAALKADSDIFTTFEGDNTVLWQLVAKGLLSAYRKQFEKMTMARALRYAVRRLAERARGTAPSWPGTPNSEALRSSNFQLKLFRFREEHLLESLALRLRKMIQSGSDAEVAIIQVQDHLIESAKAHADRIVLENFVEGIKEGPADSRPSLDRLRSLHGLSELENHRAWYLEHGVFDRESSKAIRSEVNALLSEVRPEAEAFVEAWSIPRELIAAPIAF